VGVLKHFIIMVKEIVVEVAGSYTSRAIKQP
jgi:hypothetical protein